jgi:hypothetical protein
VNLDDPIAEHFPNHPKGRAVVHVAGVKV